MSDTPETDALREAIDNGAATEAEMTSLAGKFERERDQARRELDIQLESIQFHMERVPVMQLSLEAQRDFAMGEIERLRKDRDEAREALRVLFKDYKELADSGDAGFWELEDKEAAQPALRILQQGDDTK